MSNMIRIGDQGPHVGQVQRPLATMGLYTGKLDNDFGPKTEGAAVALQQYHMVPDTGVISDSTWALISRLIASGWVEGQTWELRPGVMVYGHRHPDYGQIPVKRGRVSHFGGDDPDDRMYGLALIGNDLDTLKDGGRWRDLVDLGVFDKAQVDVLDSLPSGRGISYLQDPLNGFYCAMQWYLGDSRPNPHKARIGAMNDSGGLACVVPTDLGPAKPEWFIDRDVLPKHFDTSKVCLSSLGLKTEDWCNMLYLADGMVPGML